MSVHVVSLVLEANDFTTSRDVMIYVNYVKWVQLKQLNSSC